jgi:ribosome-associated protein
MKKIYIKSEFIKMDQLLKYANITATGGESKHLIKNNFVKYNGEIDDRRGKKVYPGDIVTIDLTENYNFDENIIELEILKK